MRSRVIACLLAAAVAGCAADRSPSSASSTAPSTTGSETSAVTAAIGPGCGGPAPAVDRQRLVRGNLTSSGGERHFLVYVPDAYDPDVPAPIAYSFHGATSSKEAQLVYGDLRPEADADGALLVLPDALGEPTRWSPLGGPVAGVDGVDDLVFFDDLRAEIDGDFCTDPARVLVTGMSSGGFMTGAIACLRSQVVTAAGPVTATVPPDALCRAAEPVPYVYFHGTDDPVVPFDGGGNSPGPVEDTSQAWAEHNGCDPAPADERIGTEVVHRHWRDCDASTDLYIVEGGGHTWPGAVAVGGLGYTTNQIDASAIIWATFEAAWPAPGPNGTQEM